MRAPCSANVLLLCLSLCIGLGCQGSEATQLSSDGQAIVDGKLSDRTAVVAIRNDLTAGFCSATLIAERALVTAKHCVQRPGAQAPDEPSHYTIAYGNSVDAPSGLLEVDRLVTTPGVYTAQTKEEDGTLYGVDVAIVTLRASAPFEPLAFRLEPPTDAIGKRFAAVGFGLTELGDTGRRRETELVATNASDDRIEGQAVACIGDSGGPLIDLERDAVIGVTSFAEGACGSGKTVFNTFTHLPSLFARALGGTSACLNDQGCALGESCRHDGSDIGVCGLDIPLDGALDGALYDAALPSSDAAVPDSMVTDRRYETASTVGGACSTRASSVNDFWGFLVLLALARSRRSPVASTST